MVYINRLWQGFFFFFPLKKQQNEWFTSTEGFFIIYFYITNIPKCKTIYPNSGNNNYNQGTRKTLSQLGHLNVTCSHRKEKRSQTKIFCFCCVDCYSQSNADLINRQLEPVYWKSCSVQTITTYERQPLASTPALTSSSHSQ